MRNLSKIFLALLVIAGCGGHSDKGANSGPNGTAIPPKSMTGHEGPGYPSLMMKKIGGKGWAKLSLTPQESQDLVQALKNAPQKTPGGTQYIGAHLQGGRLVFDAVRLENSKNPIGTEAEVVLGKPNSPASSRPVKLIATPNVIKLLKQRAASPAQ